jgi:hypothetical protein
MFGEKYQDKAIYDKGLEDNAIRARHVMMTYVRAMHDMVRHEGV